MATDFISREAAIKEIRDEAGCDFCDLKMAGCCLSCSAGKKIIRIRQMPAADVRPVVRGEWIDKPKKHSGVTTICSACGKRSGIGGIESNRYKPFCPNCGAELREVKSDEK